MVHVQSPEALASSGQLEVRHVICQGHQATQADIVVYQSRSLIGTEVDQLLIGKSGTW